MQIPRRFVLLLLATLLVPACALSDQVARVMIPSGDAPTARPVAADPPTLAALPTSTSIIPRGLGAGLQPTWTPTPLPSATRIPGTVTLTPRPSPSVSSPQVTPAPAATPAPLPTPTLPSFTSAADAFSAGMLARRNGDYNRAAALFQAALNLNPNTDLGRQAQFRVGEMYHLGGDDERALYALNKYLQANAGGDYAPETHYFLADLYGRAKKDYTSALAHLNAYRQQTKTLAGDVDALIADVLVRSGDTTTAIATYDRALADTTLSAASRVSILLRAGAAHLGRGEPARAAARYDAGLALAKDAPTRAALYLAAGQAYAAANQLDLAVARWANAIDNTPEQPGALQALWELTNRSLNVDHLQRGVVEYHAGNYDAAITALTRYLAGGGTRVGEARYFRARAYAGKNAYTQAIAEYDTIINSLPQDSRVADAFMGKAFSDLAIGKLDQAIADYQALARALPDSTRAPEALLKAGDVLERLQRYRDAAVLFDRLQKDYATRDQAAEALFRAGINYHRAQDDPTAALRWQALVQRYRSSDFYTAALFWLGKIYAARGQTNPARSYWQQAAVLAPEVFRPFRRTYYAYRSRTMLNPLPAADPRRLYEPSRYTMDQSAARPELERWLAGWTRSDSPSLSTLDASIRDDLHFRRGEELLELDRFIEARNEFSIVVGAHDRDVVALYALARYFQDKELYSLSVMCADDIALLAMVSSAPPAPRGLLLLRFPTYYADLVLSESQANRLDPLLYFAVLRLESHFDTWATGPVVERGLAQINPQVAPAIVQALKIQNYNPDQLYRPYLSIKMGSWLFAQNYARVDDPIYAMAAYNVGLNTVLAWQQPDVDMAVEDFDIDFARIYVDIVYPNWLEYQDLYR